MGGSIFNTLFLVGGVIAVGYFVLSYLAPSPVINYVQQYNPGEAFRLRRGIQSSISG